MFLVWFIKRAWAACELITPSSAPFWTVQGMILTVSGRHFTRGAIHSTKISWNFGWIGSLQPDSGLKSSKTTVHHSGWTAFLVRTGAIENWTFQLTILTYSQSQYLPVRSFSIFNMEENNYHCSFYGLLTADSSVLLVHPCAVTAGSQLFCRLRYALAFEKQFNCRENVFFSHSKVVRQISRNGLLKITSYTG